VSLRRCWSRPSVTLDFKQPGDAIFLLGDTGAHTGGSEYFRFLGELEGRAAEIGDPAPFVGNRPPDLDPSKNVPLYQALERAIRSGIVRSAATPAKGGLAVALTRCAIAGRLGASIDLGAATDAPMDTDLLLFSETNGRFIVATEGSRADDFAEHFQDLPCHRIGTVEADGRLVMRVGADPFVEVEVEDLRAAFQRGLADA
jgi:phosphoribosylformylglycinamidine (FGAM) synthase-like enzyme